MSKKRKPYKLSDLSIGCKLYVTNPPEGSIYPGIVRELKGSRILADFNTGWDYVVKLQDIIKIVK